MSADLTLVPRVSWLGELDHIGLDGRNIRVYIHV